MGIKNIQISQVGLPGVVPQIIYLETDDSVNDVSVPGYLNQVINTGYTLAENMFAIVSTQESATSPVVSRSYDVSYSGGKWSLVSQVRFAVKYTTVGGSASEAITIAGLDADKDLPFVQLIDDGTNNVSVLSAAVTANTLTITFSGNPGNDTVISYQIVRATS